MYCIFTLLAVLCYHCVVYLKCPRHGYWNVWKVQEDVFIFTCIYFPTDFIIIQWEVATCLLRGWISMWPMEFLFLENWCGPTIWMTRQMILFMEVYLFRWMKITRFVVIYKVLWNLQIVTCKIIRRRNKMWFNC